MVLLKIDGTADYPDYQATCSSAGTPQTTLKGSVTLTGRGLHSGETTRVTIHPAPQDTGIVFRDGSRIVRGLVSNVIDTSRGTTVGSNGSRFRTVEHLMAALRGSGVDNAVVEVFGEETPALDGSAKPYVDAIESAGLGELSGTERRAVTLQEPVCVRYNGSFILAVPAPQLRITYIMKYEHPLIGCQSSTYELNESSFGSEIAPARTFVLYEEVAGLLESQLARGGSLDNAVVVWQDRMSSDLRFPDELVRHKVLDMVGDLSLIGNVLQAEVLAVKSGHALNIEFAREVSRAIAGTVQDTFYLEAVG